LSAKGDGPCNITLVVLLIPQSEKLAQIFADVGVKHVIAFSQTESKPMSESLLLALQFNYIFAFCEVLYKQIAQKQDLRNAFTIAKETVNDEYMTKLMSISKEQE
jgi:hypothetical protein